MYKRIQNHEEIPICTVSEWDGTKMIERVVTIHNEKYKETDSKPLKPE